MRTVHGHRVSPRGRPPARGRGGWILAALTIPLAAALLVQRARSTSSDATADVRVNAAVAVGEATIAPERLRALLAERLWAASPEMRCAYVTLGQGAPGTGGGAGEVELYLETLCLELVREGDSLATRAGRAGPVVVRVRTEGDSLRPTDVEVPQDGGGYADGVRRLFPAEIARRILMPNAAAMAPRRALDRALRAEARARLGM